MKLMLRSFIYHTFLLIILSDCLNAQSLDVDSLKLILKKSKIDSVQIKTALEVGKKTKNSKPDTSFEYFTLAFRKCDSILKYINSSTQSNRIKYFEADALHGIASIYLNKSNLVEAEKHNKRSLLIRNEINDRSGIAKSLNNLATVYRDQGQLEKAIEFYNKSLKIREELNDNEGVSSSLNNIALVYQDQGRISESIAYHMRSLNISNEIKNREGIASSLNNLAVIYQSQGQIPLALDFHMRSLKINEEIKNKYGESMSLNNLALIYKGQGQINQAIEYYERSLKLKEELKDLAGVADVQNNLATIYKSLGNINLALDYNYKSLKLKEQINYKLGISISLNNIANIYLSQGKFEEALNNYLLALKYNQEIGNKDLVSYTLNGLASLKLKQSKDSMALVYGLQSLEIAKELGYPERIRDVSNTLHEIYIYQKNYPAAIEMYKMYIQMKDSLKNEVNQKKSLQNKMQYEYEKTTALQKAAFEKTQDSLKLVNERKMALQALDFEYTQKQAQAKSEEERQVLLYEEALKRSRIEGDFKQKQTALKAEQLRKEAIAKAEQEKKEVLAKEEKAKQRLILLSVSLGLFLVFVFALFMYNRYKLTQKQKSIIEKQKEEVDNQRLLADSRRVIAEKQKEIIENQKHLVEEKQKEILDSINYAKRIQLTLLANEQFLKDNLNEYFSYFNPKDIVSGDFYWATKIVTSGGVENFYLAVCDSTGHGVPGAFMSLLSIGFLSEAINEKGIEQPNNVLNYVRERLTASISKEGQQDGFDGILVCFSKDKITYAAANNAPVLVRHNEIIELNADRMPVGLGERKESFNLYTLDSQKGDMLYLYTDGYADQFGGPKGKKFRYKPLNELLLSNAQLSSTEQHHQLKTTFNNWKGNIEQVDDVCVCGVRL